MKLEEKLSRISLFLIESVLNLTHTIFLDGWNIEMIQMFLTGLQNKLNNWQKNFVNMMTMIFVLEHRSKNEYKSNGRVV